VQASIGLCPSHAYRLEVGDLLGVEEIDRSAREVLRGIGVAA
jgi:hypothetical protein